MFKRLTLFVVTGFLVAPELAAQGGTIESGAMR